VLIMSNELEGTKEAERLAVVVSTDSLTVTEERSRWMCRLTKDPPAEMGVVQTECGKLN